MFVRAQVDPCGDSCQVPAWAANGCLFVCSLYLCACVCVLLVLVCLCLCAPCTCACASNMASTCATQVKAGAQTPFRDHIITLHLRIIFLCCSLLM